jgi:D-xylose transport system ATP-binding protein
MAVTEAPVSKRTGPTVLEARSLTKTYGHVVALDNVSVDIYEDETVALVGDNGAGKTTFVSLLSGLLRPDSGAIHVGGEEVSLSSPERAASLGIATVFQNLALVDQRDVAANLHLGREPTKFGGMVVDRRRMLNESTTVLKQLGITLPSVRSAVRDLSGGQRQAVAIARALLRRGRLLLLDEPTAALGVRESRQVTELLKRLRRDEHLAILIVTHNMSTVFELADRVLVFRHGHLVGDLVASETNEEEVVSRITGAYRGEAH